MPAVEEPVRPSVAAPRRRLRPAVVLNVVFLGGGAALLAVLVLKLDTAQVAARLRQVGWAGLGMLGCYVAGLVVTTAAWQSTIDPARSRARFRHLFAAFWAGHALNAITPGGSLGEVWRGTIMRGRVEPEEIVASLVVFNFMSTVSMLCFNLLAPLLCLALLDLPGRVVSAVLAISLALFVPWIAVWLLLRRGAVALLVRLVGRLPLVRLRDPEALLARARTVDDRIRAFRGERPRAFRAMVGWLALARLCQAAEYLALLPVLVAGRPLWWLGLVALLTQASSQILAWVMTFVPSGIGVAEGNTMLLYRLLGLDPVVGLTMEIVRHARTAVGVAVGLVLGWIAVARGGDAPAAAAAAARVDVDGGG